MTNTPSPTDEDRELIVGLKRATRHCDNAGAIAAIEQAADRLESLLSDRAKLEEALLDGTLSMTNTQVIVQTVATRVEHRSAIA